MAYRILILGASYGSLLGTKLAMAGHEVTLVCRAATAGLINAEGTVLRLRLKGEEARRAIREAVHDDPALSRGSYGHVDAIARRLGAEAGAQVRFEKYARAAEGLLKPSSAARAVLAGAPQIERVDRLVQLVGRQLGLSHPAIDEIVATVDAALSRKRVQVA